MYTESKDDYLDEDPVIPSQRIALISILSPSTVKAIDGLDWKTNAIKIRGVFESEEAAQSRLKYLEKIDPYHHIFAAPVGRWLPWSDDEDNAEDVKYSSMDELNQMMKKHKEHIDKVKDHDNERKVNARKNAIAHNKRMAKRAKKLEKQMGKTTEQIVADEIISNDINTMQGMSREEMIERMKKIREDDNNKEKEVIDNIIIEKSTELIEKEKEQKINEAQQRINENQNEIEDKKNTIDKLEEECNRVREQLERMKNK